MNINIDGLSSSIVLGDDGRWVTVNGTHILIKDGAGSQHDQVAGFLAKKARRQSESGGDSDKRNMDGGTHHDAGDAFTKKAGETHDIADHMSAHAHHASGTAYDALKSNVSDKIKSVHDTLHAGIQHVQDLAKRIHDYPGQKVAQAKAAISNGVKKVQDIAKHAKEGANAKQSWMASKYHSAAAIYHQVAGDLHKLGGNKELAEHHAKMAGIHINERDRHDAIVNSYNKSQDLNKRIGVLQKLHGISKEDATGMAKRADAGEATSSRDKEILQKWRDTHGDKSTDDGRQLKSPPPPAGEHEPEHEHKHEGEHEPEHEHKHEGGHGERHGGAEGGRGGSGMGGMRSSGSYGSQHKAKKRKIMMPKKHLGLSLMDSMENYLFVPGHTGDAIALGTRTTANGAPVQRFRKEIIYEGAFVKPSDSLAFTVTPQSLHHWVNTFNEMQSNGVDCYFPSGHTNDPAKNRGYWRKFEVAPYSKDNSLLALWGEVDAVGDDGIGLIGRSDVSLYSPAKLEDGKGHVYKRPLVHVAACVDPVIPGLAEWQAVAASLAVGDDSGQSPPAVLIPFAPTSDNGSTVKMIADGLEPDIGEACINEQELRAFMQELKRGDRIAGAKYMGGMPVDPGITKSQYEGVVRRVRDTSNLNDPSTPPSDAPRNVTVVMYDDGTGDWEDVLSCEPHIMFCRYRAEIDAGQSKPANLSLDGSGQMQQAGKGKADDTSNPNDPNAAFVAAAAARADGTDTDDDEKTEDSNNASSECECGQPLKDNKCPKCGMVKSTPATNKRTQPDTNEKRSLALAWKEGKLMSEKSNTDLTLLTNSDIEASMASAIDANDIALVASLDAEIARRLGEVPVTITGTDAVVLSQNKDDYGYTPGEDPSAWKLPIGDPEHVSAACAALSAGGFRGQKVDIPDADRSSVVKKVRSAWKKHYPDKSEDDMPESIKASREDLELGGDKKQCCDCENKLCGEDGEEDGRCVGCTTKHNEAELSREPRREMNVAVILNRLGYDDMSEVTLDNCESMILAGIDALEARVIQEAETNLENEREAITLSLSGRQPSEIEVNLSRENYQLRLDNLIDSGHLTPAAANEFKKLLATENLSLSLSRGDGTLNKVLQILALNEPVHLKEVTGAQTKGAVRLSRKTGKPEPIPGDDGASADDNPLQADADRRRKDWEAQKNWQHPVTGRLQTTKRQEPIMRIENIAAKLGLELSQITEENAEQLILGGIDTTIKLAHKKGHEAAKRGEDEDEDDDDDDEDDDEDDDDDDDDEDARLSRSGSQADILVRDAEQKSAQALELSRKAASCR